MFVSLKYHPKVLEIKIYIIHLLNYACLLQNLMFKAETDTQGVPSKFEEELLYCVITSLLFSIVLVSVTRTDCPGKLWNLSLTRDTQQLSGRNPGWPCLCREVGSDDPLWSPPTQPQPIL